MEWDSDILNKVSFQSTNRHYKVNKDFDNNIITENVDSYNKEIMNSTPIQEFYENQCIFITGGTGFLGKILIEKLLRSCPKISKIFVLLRPKRDKTVDERVQDLFNDSVFDNARSNLKTTLYAVAGDCQERNLGISDNDIELLKENVSIVFHVAATVRFNENLKEAFTTNIQSTSSIIDLCKQMKNLKSFMHISTLYTNCFAENIEEKFYDYPVNHKELEVIVNNLPKELIDTITPQLIKPWPNTYTFTKALAEDLVRKMCTDLPVAIFRPGIVTPSGKEPIAGWTNNYNGLTGVIASVASGFMRIWHCNRELTLPFVPVDFTVNAMIASAWATSIQKDRRGENMLIYNYTSTNDAPITLSRVIKNIVKYTDHYPPMNAVWCAIFESTRYKVLYDFYIVFLHLIPAYFVDFLTRIAGQKPRFLATYQKIHTMARLLRYFCINYRQFKDKNRHDLWNQLEARDKEIFQFSMVNFDWDTYFCNCSKGIRVFLFKDDLKTLMQSRIKYKRLLWMHQFMVNSCFLIIGWILYRVMSSFFNEDTVSLIEI